MANEVTINCSLAYADSEYAALSLAIADLSATVATKKFDWNKMAVTTAEIAVPLGNVTAPGWAIFVNRDVTNYIELRVATGGAKFAKMKAGEPAIMRLGSGAQVPYAIADTATCQMEFLIIST